MPSKVTTPISVLLFFYLLIVALSLMFLGLTATASYDIGSYFKKQKVSNEYKSCRKYFEQKQYDLYEKCYSNLKNK